MGKLQKGLSDRELEHLETMASIKGEAKHRSALTLATVIWNIAPSTYTSLIAFAMWYDNQYGVAALVAASVVFSWALHGMKRQRDD